MRYFIESVTTYSTSGKSRKGAILQTAVQRFEHTILGDDTALSAFVFQLRRLVDAVNSNYKGKTVMLRHNASSGHICATVDSSGYSTDIFSISYAPVGETIFASNVRNEITDVLYNVDRKLLAEYRKIAYTDGSKGGAE